MKKLAWNSTLKKLRSWHLVPSLDDKWKGKKLKQRHFLGLQITADGNCCHEIKRRLLLGRKAMTNLDSVLKSTYNTLLTKLHIVKATVFPSSHVWIWKLDHKEDWASKNWCFWIVVLEQTVESPLDSKENKPVNPKGNQPWIFTRSETGGKGAGHNFWKNDIARGYNRNWLESGNGTPLQYSCLENPIDGGAWWTAVHRVAKSQTGLSDFTFTFHFYALEKEMATHSSVLAWRVPGTGHPGGLPSVGSHRVGHDWSDSASSRIKWV